MGIKKNSRYKKRYINRDFLKDEEDKVNSDKFNKLSRILSEYTGYEASDGIEYNLLSWKPRLIRAIDHLPDYEQRFIIHKFDRISKLKSVLGRYQLLINKKLGKNYDGILELRKSQIFDMYAMFYSTEDIHKKLVEESGMNFSMKSLKHFYLKHKSEIENIQLEYERNVGAIGISRKRSRLEVLDYMLRRAKQEYDEKDGLQMLPFSREMSKILEQARKEVEGERLQLNIDGTINITATIESVKSVEKLYSDINFMNLLIARVAARIGVNPLLLQHQLTTSWYSRFTGIKRNRDILVDTPKYPSSIVLNWNDIVDKAESKTKENEEITRKYIEDVECEIVDEDKKRSEKLREALKARVKNKQEALEEIKNRVLDRK